MRLGPNHLQVAGGGCVVDLDVGAVGRWQRQAVPEPQHRGTGVGFHLTANVGGVPLPCVDHYRAKHLGNICGRAKKKKKKSFSLLEMRNHAR